MGFILDSIALGLEYGLLALGVFITFKVLNIPDLTVDGSFVFGMAASGVLTAAGHPFLGLLCALLAGAGAGVVTGILQTKAGIHPLLAGVLTMTGLYTINITVLGAPNVSLLNTDKFYTWLYQMFPQANNLTRTILLLMLLFMICAAFIVLLALFFKTVLGLCIRATGNNEAMVRASSINTDMTKISALALANALVGLSGGLVAQCQGFADISSGNGMIVVAFASVIIGEVIFGKRSVTIGLISAVTGSVAYRIIIALALKVEVPSIFTGKTIQLFPADALKLISAIIVALTLMYPTVKRKLTERKLKREAMKNS